MQSLAVTLSTSPKLASTRRRSLSSATRLQLYFTRMPSGTKVPSPPPRVSSSTSLASGKKTGRSLKDKRIVYEETSNKDDIWWGSINIKMDERTSFRLSLSACGITFSSSTDTFEINRERAIDYLNTRDNVYVFDGFAGVGLC